MTDANLLQSSEIIMDPQERWWVTRLNRLSQVQTNTILPARVRIRDCTLREGEELAGAHLSHVQKLHLAEQIQGVGIDEIEIGYCGAIDEHRDLAKLLRQAGIGLKLISLGRAYARDGEWQAEIDRTVEQGVDTIVLMVCCEDDLLASVPWLVKDAVPDRVYDSISYARRAGIGAEASLVGATRTSLRWIEAFAQAAAAAGADGIGLADSTGCAVPELVTFLVRLARDAAGPGPELTFHCHNTFGLATANALAAVKAGAQVVQAVPLGLGEGAGITSLEEIVFALEVLYGVDTGVAVDKVADLCRSVQHAFDVALPPTKTFLGTGLYRHTIDSHIAAILRGSWHSWECVHPSVLGRQRSIEFGAAKIRRGRSGAVAAKLEQLGLVATDEQLDLIIDHMQARAQAGGSLYEAEVEEIMGGVLGRPHIGEGARARAERLADRTEADRPEQPATGG